MVALETWAITSRLCQSSGGTHKIPIDSEVRSCYVHAAAPPITKRPCSLSHLDGVQRIHDHMLQHARNCARRHIDTHTGGGQRFVVVDVHGGSERLPSLSIVEAAGGAALSTVLCANAVVAPLQSLLLLRQPANPDQFCQVAVAVAAAEPLSPLGSGRSACRGSALVSGQLLAGVCRALLVQFCCITRITRRFTDARAGVFRGVVLLAEAAAVAVVVQSVRVRWSYAKLLIDTAVARLAYRRHRDDSPIQRFTRGSNFWFSCSRLSCCCWSGGCGSVVL